ncbi:MAG TPA: HAD family hydrolase [Candidatus Hydrogenedentes bacterium]|nr:HAD family hydrolase [Candidatus Hydrogenedentota bacterium]
MFPFLGFKFRHTNKPPLLLFDYDGVIADSFDVYFSEFTRACAELGFDRLNSREAFLRLFDGNLVTQLVKAGFPLRKLRALAREFAPVIEAANARIEPFPGMTATLRHLSAIHPVLIITANTSHTVRRFLDAHELRDVKDVLGSDDETSKVKKIRAARRRFSGYCAYYMGDTRGDMIEARRAGALPVAVGWGWHDIDRLRTGGPVHIVPTQEALLALFQPNRGSQT